MTFHIVYFVDMVRWLFYFKVCVSWKKCLSEISITRSAMQFCVLLEPIPAEPAYCLHISSHALILKACFKILSEMTLPEMNFEEQQNVGLFSTPARCMFNTTD